MAPYSQRRTKEIPAECVSRIAYPCTPGHGNCGTGRQCGRSYPQGGLL